MILKEDTFYKVITEGMFSRRYAFELARLRINDVILVTGYYKAESYN